MVEYLKKQDNKTTDLGFKTTASLITDMLKEIRKSYLSKDKESKKMNKKLLYAIEKLNSKKSLFTIDNNVNFSEEEENEPKFLVQDPNVCRKQRSGVQNSSYRRRHSVQVGTNWLQEYSTFNMN